MLKLDPTAHEHAGADHILSFLRRARLDWLLHHFPQRLVRSVYVFVNGFVTIGLLAVLALVSHNPFVFPSLGPTAYLLFFSPLGETSSPRNTIFGHAIGLDHPSAAGELMSYRYDERQKGLQPGDTEGVVLLYGPRPGTTPYADIETGSRLQMSKSPPPSGAERPAQATKCERLHASASSALSAPY